MPVLDYGVGAGTTQARLAAEGDRQPEARVLIASRAHVMKG